MKLSKHIMLITLQFGIVIDLTFLSKDLLELIPVLNVFKNLNIIKLEKLDKIPSKVASDLTYEFSDEFINMTPFIFYKQCKYHMEKALFEPKHSHKVPEQVRHCCSYLSIYEPKHETTTIVPSLRARPATNPIYMRSNLSISSRNYGFILYCGLTYLFIFANTRYDIFNGKEKHFIILESNLFAHQLHHTKETIRG